MGTVDEDKVELGRKLYYAGNLEKGVPACSACHSPKGLGNGPAAYPLLSGQQPEYVAKALKDYRSGARINQDPSKIMAAIAYKLDDDEIDAYLVLCMVYTNKMFRNQFLLFSLLIALLSCSNDDQTTFESGNGERFRAGVHYELLDNPTKVRDPSKIEVTEVFWFGCNHCYALEPYIARWKRDIPLDVTFIKSPATWNDMLKTHARIYYTAKALGIEQQFVPAAFNTIQNEGKMLTGNTELEYYLSLIHI